MTRPPNQQEYVKDECVDARVELTAQHHLKLAYMFAEAQMWEEARVAAECAHHMVGHLDPTPALMLASQQIARGEFVEALGRLKKVARRFPDVASAHIYMSEVYCFLKRPRQGRRSLERAKGLYPTCEESQWIDGLSAYWFPSPSE